MAWSRERAINSSPATSTRASCTTKCSVARTTAQASCAPRRRWTGSWSWTEIPVGRNSSRRSPRTSLPSWNHWSCASNTWVRPRYRAWPPSRSSTSTWWSPARNYCAPSWAASSRPATGGWAISTWPVVKPLRLLRHRPSLPEHHLYLVVENNRAHCDHWLFRNSLNAYPELRDRYSAIKRENAVLARSDIDRYVALKAAFVAQVLTVARRERAMAPVTYWEPDLD